MKWCMESQTVLYWDFLYRVDGLPKKTLWFITNTLLNKEKYQGGAENTQSSTCFFLYAMPAAPILCVHVEYCRAEAARITITRIVTVPT